MLFLLSAVGEPIRLTLHLKRLQGLLLSWVVTRLDLADGCPIVTAGDEAQ